MRTENFVPLDQLCSCYKVEMDFFGNLGSIGLIEIVTIEQDQYVHDDQLTNIEKMVRMHRELEVNIEGIDIAFNLLQKIDDLQAELIALKNRLRLYEDDI
jgi:hypothetical protein